MVLNPPSSLVFLGAKKKWYVVVTIPAELRPAFGKRVQERRSTGTSDKRIAKGLEHTKAAEIYKSFEDARRELNPLKNAVNALETVLTGGTATWTEEAYADSAAQLEMLEEARGRVSALKHHITDDEEEARAVGRVLAKSEPLLAKVEEEYAKATGTAPRTERLSELAKDWLAKTTFRKEKTKDAATKAVEHFIDVMGDLVASTITKSHAYEFATDQTTKLASKTIANRITYVSQCLTFGERHSRLDGNPFKGLSLEGYGRKEQSYTPFEKPQLEALFRLPMPDEDRKLLSILITTGMRLDEAALLTWEDMKEQDGIPFFDLTAKEKKVKNIGSARKVPIIPELAKVLGDKGSQAGRLFTYKTDKDGKAQSAASKALMKQVKKVRGTDTTKVVHSLRGSFKDFLRDAGVSKETNDFITGHAGGDVASSYGSGPSLKSRFEALSKVKHPWLA